MNTLVHGQVSAFKLKPQKETLDDLYYILSQHNDR